MHRRTFLQAVASASALSESAKPQPAPSTSAPGDGIRLGFDTYSLRAFGWKDIQLLDYAAGLRVDTIQISDSKDYTSLDPVHLRQVREHAEHAGIRIDSGIGCICPKSKSWNPQDGPAPEKLIRGMQVAKAVGARSMRCFMGSLEDRRSPRPIEELMEATIGVFRAVANHLSIPSTSAR